MPAVYITYPFVVKPGEGLDAPLAVLGTVHKVPDFVTEGRLAVVEHTLAPGKLAAPLHRHSREDELSIVLEGQLGAILGEDILTAGPGSYVLKPRGQWHTFWNAGDEQLRFVELLIPGGFDRYFRRMSALFERGTRPTPAEMASLAAEYGLEFDLESVPSLCTRFGLSFG